MKTVITVITQKGPSITKRRQSSKFENVIWNRRPAPDHYAMGLDWMGKSDREQNDMKTRNPNPIENYPQSTYMYT